MRVTRGVAAAKMEASAATGDMATPLEPYKSVAARARDALEKEKREAEEKAELERQAAAANAAAAGRRPAPSSRRNVADGAGAGTGRDAVAAGGRRGGAAAAGASTRTVSRGSTGGAAGAGAGAGGGRPTRGTQSSRTLASGTVATSAGVTRPPTTEEDIAAAKVQSLVSASCGWMWWWA
jgi:hypothetical protein